jgi:predicted nucleotidyltransferase component of viral defense system
MDPVEIRKIAIIAMFSDDVLLEQLVLKGGNALDIVLRLSARGSYDIDFSMAGDFDNVEEVQGRIFRALRDRFDSVGMIVFDEKFARRPHVLREGQGERWGGYSVEFKLISKAKAAELAGDIDANRRNAAVLGLANERIFRIEISKYEYVEGKIEKELDAYTVFVYSPEMIAAEKFRALCQQMPEYAPVRNKRARARDFYDIHTVLSRTNIDLTTQQNHELLTAIFAAKDVPLKLLGQIGGQREFHEPDWPSVTLATAEPTREFQFYFDFVVEQVEKLKPLWDV